jgi:predicted molibdopterin-dependent oxidoreductase YjgC
VFRREGGGLSGRFSFEGQVVEFADGDSVAAALLAHGVAVFRETAESGAARGPFCLMGVCFDCLVEIDGVGSRQACLVAAAQGMVVRRMRGAR